MRAIVRFAFLVWAFSPLWGHRVPIETEGLAGARIRLYVLKPWGKRRLLVHRTSARSFELKVSKLHDDALYLIRVSKGALRPGFITGRSSPGVFRALVTGRDLRQNTPIRVSAVSELLYERFAARLRSSPSPRRLIPRIDDEAAAILARDIDGDGRIDHRDILQFRLDRDRGALRRAYRTEAVLEAPYRGRPPLLQCRRELSRTRGDFSQIVSLVPTPKHLWALWYDGNLSDLAAADPTKPVAHFAGVFAGDALRYDGASHKLFLFDINDSRPTIRILDARNPRRVSATVPGSADDLAILNGRYYLLEAKALRTLDPRTLQTIDTIPLPKGDDRRFVLDRRRRLLYLIGKGPLRVYRIAKNGALRRIGSYPDLADCFELALYDGGERALAIVDSGMEGVKVLDLSDPRKIHILQSLRYGGMARPPIRIDGDRALVEWDGTLVLLDLRKNDRPAILGRFASPMRSDSLNSPGYALTDDGREAWVAGDAGLLRYDTTLHSALFTLDRIHLSDPDKIRIDPETHRVYLTDQIGDAFQLVVLHLERGRLRILSRFPDYDEKRGPFFESMIFALLDPDRGVAADDQGEVYLLDLHRSRVRVLRHLEAVEKAFDSPIESLLPFEGGTRLLVGSDKGRVALFATPPGKKERLLTSLHLGGAIQKLASLDDGSVLALVADTGIVRLRITPTKILHALTIIQAPDAVSFRLDGGHRHLYLIDKNGTIRRYALRGGTPVLQKTIGHKGNEWTTIAFSRDGRFLFVGDKGLEVYDRRSLRRLGRYPIAEVRAIRPLDEMRLLVTGESALLSLDLSLLYPIGHGASNRKDQTTRKEHR